MADAVATTPLELAGPLVITGNVSLASLPLATLALDG